MKEEKLTNLIERLAQKRSEIDQREKILRERERKLKTRRFIEVGSLASKFGIDALDDETLMGAFAELQEKSKQEGLRVQWKEKGMLLSINRQSPLIISFRKEPSDQVKAALKEKRFKWNTFRKEWHGYGIKEEVEGLIKEFDGKVDVAKD